MTTDKLNVVAPNRRKDFEAICELGAKVFAWNGYYIQLDYNRDGYIGRSHYDWDASRVGFVDGKMVTHFGVWGYQMRIGTARVRVGGVGMVATDGEYRKRGLMRHTTQACLEAMRTLGYDLTMLFGIHNFYDQFGYVRAWPEITHTVKIADLPGAALEVRLNKFIPRPRKDIADFFNRQYGTVTGTAVRPNWTAKFFPGNKELQGYLWRNDVGQLAGYVMYIKRGHRLDCVEFGGEIAPVLSVLNSLCRKLACDEVRFETMPFNDPLLQRVRRSNCDVEAHYLKSGGAMVGLLNLRSTCEKMMGEFTHRLRQSPLADWNGNLLIANHHESVVLKIADGAVGIANVRQSKHAIHGDSNLARLFLGSDEPEEVMAAAEMKTSGDAPALAKALFPNQHPNTHLGDRY